MSARKGPGRPTKDPAGAADAVTIKLGPTVTARLRAVAKALGVTYAEVVEMGVVKAERRLELGKKLLLLALIFLAACTVEGPSFPTVLHIAEDASAEDEATFLAAVDAWETAYGRKLVTRVERGGSGCGVYVTAPPAKWDNPRRGGGWEVTDWCKCRVFLDAETKRADMRELGAIHEIGHAIRDDGGHSDNPASVMRAVVLAGAAILNEDLR